jgi:hypothetical protein
VEHRTVRRLDALDDARRAERARVGRLAAARRVEGRAVERDGGAAVVGLRDGDDARVELDEARV